MLDAASLVTPIPAGRKRSHILAAEMDLTPVPVDRVTASQNPRRQSSPDGPAPSKSAHTSSSAFRNVSACHRCRIRKNRCDQHLPRCQSCEKAGVPCVGYDPITKREIPRSYVYFLEARVAYLERVLRERDVEFMDAVAFGREMAANVEEEEEGKEEEEEGESGLMHGGDVLHGGAASPEDKGRLMLKHKENREDGRADADRSRDDDKDDNWKIHNLVSNIGMVSVQGTSDPRYLGSTSGISFARVVFAAVKSSVSGNASERGPMRPSERLPHSATGTGTSTMRDSFFGLQTRSMMKCATFPQRDLAEKLVDLYFEHANPQMPILHRADFMELLDGTYAVDEKSRSPRSLYTLNIVFAIGAGIIFEDKSVPEDDEQGSGKPRASSTPKRQKLSNHQCQPEEYHASAVVHLESFLDSSATNDGFGGLEELQAVLLLASFALLRPVAPGLWYIVGVAMRLAVDLGLHYEDGTGVDYVGQEGVDRPPVKGEDGAKLRINTRERGRREWARDMRRRLWWCVYSFDRLVGCCVGRPFGISDQAISTEFPSLLEDKYITKSGIVTPPDGAPSYKHAAHHYFKLRVLQSEIQDVLQYQQARFARQRLPHSANVFTRSDLPSPFLQGFDSLRSWRRDMNHRLVEWKETAPKHHETGVRFPVEFLELNYWQAVIMLYQQCLTAPAELAGELAPAEDVSSPSFSNIDDAEDEDEIYYKVAEAGQKVIRIYRSMHRLRLVNYTYLATHHIFMAGISFLYAIWHSPWVRSRLTPDEVDFTVLAATSVLGDLMHKCPPAEACRDAFERMSKATVQMSLSTTGFGLQVDLSRHSRANAPQPLGGLYRGPRYPRRYSPMDQRQRMPGSRRQTQRRAQAHQRQIHRFDMNLEDLFGGDTSTVAQERSDRNTRNSMQPHSTRARGFSELSPTSVVPEQMSRIPAPHQRAASMEYAGNYEDHPFSPQQQQYYTDSLQQGTSPDRMTTNNSNQPPLLTPDQEAGMSMDLLDFDPDSQLALGLDGNPDYDAIMPSLGPGVGHSVGIDLGFGMAVDFQHDWSENANYDMLEGFFFGGSGSGGAGAGPTTGTDG